MTILRRAAVAVGLAVVLVFQVPVLVAPVVPLPALLDQTARYTGWHDYAATIETIRERHGARYILGPHYSSPAYLRFYLDADAPAFQLGEFERWSHFDGLGTAPADFAEAPGLYIGRWGDDSEREFVEAYFDTVTRLDNVVRRLRGGQSAEASVWLVGDPKPEALALFGLQPG